MRFTIFFNIIFILSLLSGCEKQPVLTESSSQIFAMDTIMDLYVYGENSNEVLNLAEKEIRRIDNMLKKDNPQGEIYILNKEKMAEVSSETADIIDFALYISNETDGAFDISISPVMDLWGFYNQKFNVPDKNDIVKELERVNYKNIKVNENNISIKNNSQIDLGGIAKGFTSDSIIKIFKENNMKSGLISLGGNVQSFGLKPNGEKWKVGIQNPDENSSIIGSLETEESAIITSGGYQRYFEENGIKYHHIIDTKTGFPANSGIKSATVISKSGILADGFSTSLFAMGLEKSINLWKSRNDFDFIIETSDNKIYITEGLENDFKSEFEYTIIRK